MATPQFASPLDVIRSRLEAGALDSSLNFPLNGILKDAFTAGNMDSLKLLMKQVS
jgi:hypothetical protein